MKKTTKERVEEEEDFCYCPRLGNSIYKLIDKNPDGVSDERIAKVLLIKEEEVAELFESAIKKLREKLQLDNKED